MLRAPCGPTAALIRIGMGMVMGMAAIGTGTVTVTVYPIATIAARTILTAIDTESFPYF